MSTMHRLLASAFGTAGFPAPEAPPTEEVSARAGADLGAGVLTCSPWMGLYFEETDAAW